MNDLDLIQRFRGAVPAPDDERTTVARGQLMAEVLRAADATAGATAARHERRRDRRGSVRDRWRAAITLRVGIPAVAAASGAIAAIVLAGGGMSGSGTPTAEAAIIHHADLAFAAAPNEIFHSKLEGEGFVAQSWQLTSTPYTYLAGKGPIDAVQYAASDGTSAAYYDPATNTIHQLPNSKKPGADQTAPYNPLTEIQLDLQDGRARVLGTASVGGTATYAIQFADKDGFDTQSTIAYVDRTSYRPIEIVAPQSNGTTIHLRVVAFEYLPATPANMSLLSLRARYPSAHVVTDPATTGAASGK